MSQAPNDQKTLSGATLIGYAVFAIFVVALGAFYLFADFRGLTDKHGIDQAQIARQIVRGEGWSTKFLRPFSLYQAQQEAQKMENGSVNLDRFEDTYHAPLGPLVNAAALKIGGEDQLGLDYRIKGSDRLDPKRQIYKGDRIIAAGTVVIYLAAILVFYLLAARIFDRRIGLLVATSMILCDMLWRFTHTGLPTSLILFLFGFALFFLYKGVESVELERPPTGWAVLSAAFFGLMALSHWITIWIFLGALLFAAFAMKPRGTVGGAMLLTFLAVITPGLIRNFQITGTVHGDALYAIYNGLGALGESGAMRNFKPDKETLALNGFAGRVAVTSLNQFGNLIGYLGSMLAAPIFFVGLLHPFKRPEIARFRWGILAMWIFAVLGMGIFGLPDEEMDINQMHILFAPVMAAYGLAMIAVLWNRYGLPLATPLARNVPFIIIVVVSAIPLFVSVPRILFKGGVFAEQPNYPPYHPPTLSFLNEWTDENEVIVTDMPWGTAWYADRLSAWQPTTMVQFDNMVEFFDDSRHPVAGIFFSPVTTNKRLAGEVMVGPGADWSYFVLQPQFARAMRSTPRREDSFRFGVLNPMSQSQEMGFWSNRNRAEESRREREAARRAEEEPGTIRDFGPGTILPVDQRDDAEEEDSIVPERG